MLVTLIGNKAIQTSAEATLRKENRTIVIDAGHGGEDGGATSCTGVLESHINLQIALRLDDLLHLLGYDTVMIRKTDISVYTEGNSIAQKKISDLKERVRIVNSIDNGILVSIHQNMFPDSRYSGAQVFYNNIPVAKELAQRMQNSLVKSLNPGSNRQCKQSSGVYLMEHINYPGLLVECGFLSNPEEESKLRSEEYQKKLCCVIAVHLAQAAN
jgi:N-acetylmuramoyl-L-alanine amidase